MDSNRSGPLAAGSDRQAKGSLRRRSPGVLGNLDLGILGRQR